MSAPPPEPSQSFEAVERSNRDPDALLDADAAAALLAVPARWIMAEARANRLPSIRLGRYVRFDRRDLLAWAAGRKRGPRPRRTGTQPVPIDRDGQ